jgi:hypothetical protein
MLEFLNDIGPVFEEFLLLFQKATPVIHIMYDSICRILMKLMRRFMKMHALEKKYGAHLASVESKNVELQLSDKDIVIGSATRTALAELNCDQQRHCMLGIRSFFHTTVSQLQQKLPLNCNLLRQLGCVNPTKYKKESTVASIESLTGLLQPKLNVSQVVDEWKILQVDIDLPDYDQQERIEKYWNEVFKLQAQDGSLRYKLLPTVIKSALLLGQTNAESEHSLSVNARMVTHERSLLGEKTIVSLLVVKEAVRFFDPVSNQPQNIDITEDLKKSVKCAHAAYIDRIEREKEEKEKQRAEAQKQTEMSEKSQKEMDKMLERKASLEKSEESLNEDEEKAREELRAADELLKDATSKLDSALSTTPVNTNSISVARMMLETANKAREEAMEKLDKIRGKQRSLDKKGKKLLEQAMPSRNTAEKRNSEGEHQSAKKLKK